MTRPWACPNCRASKARAAEAEARAEAAEARVRQLVEDMAFLQANLENLELRLDPTLGILSDDEMGEDEVKNG